MKKVLLALLLHQNKFGYNTAIRLAKQVLIKKGYDEDALPSNITFKRFAEHFRRNHYAEWVLRHEGMKAYHDKVEPYIERDISKIEVGDILIADGHVLNFQVIIKTIYSMVNNKVSTDDLGDAQKEFVDLIHAYQNGELNDKMCKTVKKQMGRIKKELEKLEELKKKGIAFNEGEQAQYDLFKMWDNMWD